MRVTVAFAGPALEPESEFDRDLGTELDRSGVTHPDGARYRAFQVERDGSITPVLRSAEEIAAEDARTAPPPAPAEQTATIARPEQPPPLSDRPGVATSTPMLPLPSSRSSRGRRER